MSTMRSPAYWIASAKASLGRLGILDRIAQLGLGFGQGQHPGTLLVCRVPPVRRASASALASSTALVRSTLDFADRRQLRL